jgi:hypothetical protein
MIDLSTGDWITVASFGLLIFGKLATDVADYATKRHDSAVGRIAGMAGREAASIARVIEALPATPGVTATEHDLVTLAGARVLGQMTRSAGITGASADVVQTIVQSELDKLLIGRPAVIDPATRTPPAPPERPIPALGATGL